MSTKYKATDIHRAYFITITTVSCKRKSCFKSRRLLFQFGS